MKKIETTHLKASRVGGVDQRRIKGVGLRCGSAAWGLGRLGSLMKWVSWWVGDVKLRWASDVEDRVGPGAVR